MPSPHAPSRSYHVLRAVGRGGFGTVYEGRIEGALGFRKRVALKVLHADVARIDEAVQRLRDEARILGLVRHSAIVGVDDLVQIDGRWVLVMEYVDGVGLDHVLRHREVPPRVALDLIARAAGALATAWSQPGPDGAPLRLLHRDLKPANLQITAAGELKILDFGIARAEFATREADTRSLMLGSLAYMAPERLDRVDGPAGDVYALGVVLYELLTRARFGTTFAHQPRHMAHLSGRVAAVRELPEHGPALARLLAEVLTFEPGDRPTAIELQDRCQELASVVGGERMERWCRAVVPRLQAVAPEPPDGELSGFTLGPGASGPEAAAPSLPPDPAAVTAVPAGAPADPDLHHAHTAPAAVDEALHAATEPGAHHDLLEAQTVSAGGVDLLAAPTTPSGAGPAGVPTAPRAQPELHYAETWPAPPETREPTAPSVEVTSPVAAQAPPAPSGPRLLVLALATAAGASLVLGGAFGAAWLGGAFDPPPQATAAPPADPLPVDARPRRKPGAEPAPPPPRRAPAQATPAPAAPPPAPDAPVAAEAAPEPAQPARVRFVGGADRVRLSDGSQTVILLSGMKYDLLSGPWTLVPVFDGERAPPLPVEIAPQADLTIHCNDETRACEVGPTPTL